MTRSSVQRRSLRSWRAVYASRDQRIAAAFDAGLTVTEISKLSGISRKHIYTVLGREQQQCQKTPA